MEGSLILNFLCFALFMTGAMLRVLARTGKVFYEHQLFILDTSIFLPNFFFMILEIATLKIKLDKKAEFEAVLHKAQDILKAAEGYIRHDFQHCIEEEDKYVLLIQWESLEAHTEGFRKSELFKQWREMIGGFFSEAPQVLHYEQF